MYYVSYDVASQISKRLLGRKYGGLRLRHLHLPKLLMGPCGGLFCFGFKGVYTDRPPYRDCETTKNWSPNAVCL